MRRRAEFTVAVRRGSRAGTPALVAHLAVDPSRPGVRVGFIVNRSIGPAVTRNRVRRQLRHLMRARLERLPAGAALVVRATPAAAHRLSRDLAADLDAALDAALARARRMPRALPGPA